jgi:hypothetical protein
MRSATIVGSVRLQPDRDRMRVLFRWTRSAAEYVKIYDYVIGETAQGQGSDA